MKLNKIAILLILKLKIIIIFNNINRFKKAIFIKK